MMVLRVTLVKLQVNLPKKKQEFHGEYSVDYYLRVIELIATKMDN